jgi:hypothetical protein
MTETAAHAIHCSHPLPSSLASYRAAAVKSKSLSEALPALERLSALVDNSPVARTALVYPPKSLVVGALIPALHRPAGAFAGAAKKPAVGRVRHPADPYAQDISVQW